MHPCDSQINKSMNTTVGKYARKGRTYYTTMSLTKQVILAIGIQNLGCFGFWKLAFKSLSIDISPSLKHHLLQMDRKKERKCKYKSRPKRKKNGLDINTKNVERGNKSK